MRLGRRYIDGLILCAEQYAAPYDLLAAALAAQPARLGAASRHLTMQQVRTAETAGPGGHADAGQARDQGGLDGSEAAGGEGGGGDDGGAEVAPDYT